MPDAAIKQGDTYPALKGLAAEDDLPITGTSSDNKIKCDGHGYADGDIVYFPELTGGTGLTAEADYYFVKNSTRHAFEVSATNGGATIDYTSDITAGTVRRLMPLSTATSRRVLLKATGGTITGTGVTALNPPTVEGGQLFNWQYVWQAGDTAAVGEYDVELEITWSAGNIETVPNDTTVAPTLEVVAQN